MPPVKINCPIEMERPVNLDSSSPQGRADGCNQLMLYSVAAEKALQCYKRTLDSIK